MFEDEAAADANVVSLSETAIARYVDCQRLLVCDLGALRPNDDGVDDAETPFDHFEAASHVLTTLVLTRFGTGPSEGRTHRVLMSETS